MKKKLNEAQEKRIIDVFNNHIGNLIRIRRNQNGLSQEELGELLNKSKPTISLYEKGKGNIAMPILALLSYYLEFPLFQFFSKEESKMLSKTFEELVAIDIEPPTPKKSSNEKVIAKIVLENGKEVRKDILEMHRYVGIENFPDAAIKYERNRILDHIEYYYSYPFSEDTIEEYLKNNVELSDLLTASSIILRLTKNKKVKTLKRHLAKFVIHEFLESNDSDLQKLRLMEYYLAIKEKTLNISKN